MTQPISLKHDALGDLERELALTRRLLERVPDDRLAWKPHEKSMTLGRLAAHLAELPKLQQTILAHDSFDMAARSGYTPAVATSRDELLRMFDEHTAALRATLAAADDATLTQMWSLRRGDQVLMSRSKAAMLRTLGVSHIVHHRGQLSVYLRLLDVPVPSIYGPSADEGPF